MATFDDMITRWQASLSPQIPRAAVVAFLADEGPELRQAFERASAHARERRSTAAFHGWLDQQAAFGRDFDEVQLHWLDMMRQDITASGELSIDRLNYAPFLARGGQDRAVRLFGPRTLGEVVASLNATLGGKCGCTSCSRGGACPCGKKSPKAHDHRDHHDHRAHVIRFIMSEALGTLVAHQAGPDTLSIDVPHEGILAPEWAAGRTYESIREVLRFPDLAPGTALAHVVLHQPQPTFRWLVTLDRRRAQLLEAVVRHAIALVEKASRGERANPVPPPRQTPGSLAWESAADVAQDAETGLCDTCPYALGTNLRCATCRAWQRARVLPAVADQERLIATVLHEQDDLQHLARPGLDDLARAVAQILATNKIEPLTDLFFLHLERDVLAAIHALDLNATARDCDVILSLVEVLLSERGIRLGGPPEPGDPPTGQEVQA